MHRPVGVVVPTLAAVAMLAVGAEVFGPGSAAFAFLVVWAPMAWLGTVRRRIQLRLPERYHDLRHFERDPWLYRMLGVRLVKGLLRRGPLAVFNPGLHLPPDRSREHLVALEQRMKDAEASHAVLFVLMIGVVSHAAVRGWWLAAGLTLLFDVALNGYPVLLQRYNRALLHARYPSMLTEDHAPLRATARHDPPLGAGRQGG